MLAMQNKGTHRLFAGKYGVFMCKSLTTCLNRRLEPFSIHMRMLASLIGSIEQSLRTRRVSLPTWKAVIENKEVIIDCIEIGINTNLACLPP